MVIKPTIVGARVLLRPLRPSDLDDYLVLLHDEVALRLTGTQRSFTRQEAQGWLATLADRDDRIDLAIVLVPTNIFLGEIVLNEIDTVNRQASLRVALHSAATGQGYGSEALRLLLGHAFEILRLHRVGLEVYAFNPGALHVYEKIGFRREGVLCDVLWSEGRFHDAILMSILEDEYWAQSAAGARAD